MTPGQLLTIRRGKHDQQTARFIRYTQHPRFGEMIVVEKQTSNQQSKWTTQQRILKSEVISETVKQRRSPKIQ